MATQNPAPAFDLIGSRYDESFVERDVQIAEAEWLISAVPAGARVLDLGCGSGLPTAKQLVDAGLDVVGVDESPVMLDLARAQAPGADYRLGDLRALTDLGEFDAVVTFFALLMLPKADIEQTLRDIRALLRGPRVLLLSMVQGDFDTFPVNFLGSPTTVSAYPPDELKRIVTEAGFTDVRLREFEAEAEPGRIEVQLYLRATAQS
ncbi:class I SAM-dependent methyltransferase [Actinokineospora sp. NBRC 105648]|uniref:class I SAM-dependent methyltransferase n=1 Tax=Actinokineospora sp. NBRC 105648 TaxID=3032206 RepID=UPI0025573483|nr:class I SAM-dependent methyltransferase [Actinokineospora sp. NBRC 105648]